MKITHVHKPDAISSPMAEDSTHEVTVSVLGKTYVGIGYYFEDAVRGAKSAIDKDIQSLSLAGETLEKKPYNTKLPGILEKNA